MEISMECKKKFSNIAEDLKNIKISKLKI